MSADGSQTNGSIEILELKKAKSLAPFTFADYPASGVGENNLYQALFDRVSAETN